MIAELLTPFDYEYMTKAMWVSALVGGVCAFLSAYLMLKGWSLMGDALAHSLLPGVAGAYMLGFPFAAGAFFAGCDSRSSTRSRFTVPAPPSSCSDRRPVLQFPDGESVAASPVQFSWLGVPRADEYRVWIQRGGSTFDNTLNATGEDKEAKQQQVRRRQQDAPRLLEPKHQQSGLCGIAYVNYGSCHGLRAHAASSSAAIPTRSR